MPDQPQEIESRSRQEQILSLAGEGLTDKEIAARLKLSPETVGTYWRRILAKYGAASRTEVVAKVVRLQAEAEVGHLTQVTEGLREVTDHLLLLQDQRPEVSEAELRNPALEEILNSMADLVVAVDSEGFTTYCNGATQASVEVGEPFEWALVASDREPFREQLAAVMSDGATLRLTLQLSHTKGGGAGYDACISRRPSGGAVLCLRTCAATVHT